MPLLYGASFILMIVAIILYRTARLGKLRRVSLAPDPSHQDDLLARLIEDLTSRNAHRIRRAETLLANYPSSRLIPRLLPILDEKHPWDEGASSAARILLLQGDETVIEPLHRFFDQREGGFSSFLDDLSCTSSPKQSDYALHHAIQGNLHETAQNIIPLWGHAGRCSRRRSS